MGIFSCIQYLICIIRICQKLKYKVKYLHGKKIMLYDEENYVAKQPRINEW